MIIEFVTYKSLKIKMDTLQKLIELRRDIHKNPELGFNEYSTQTKIINYIINVIGIDPQYVIKADTGLWVDIPGKCIYGQTDDGHSDNSKTIALRADMDALPTTENTNVEWKSINKGVHHGCGHDGHIVCLLAAMERYYTTTRNNIPETCVVRFIFQPAEEGYAGAKCMIAAGCLDGVHEIYGMHNWQGDVGSLAVSPGYVMAHKMSFEIEITGTSGHASAPQTTNDPVITACQLVCNLQTIVSRSLAGTDVGIISVTTIYSGETYNVIPASAKLTGTVRDLDPSVSLHIKERMDTIVKHTCEMNGCSGILTFNSSKPEYPALKNDMLQTQEVICAAEKSGLLVTNKGLPVLGAEDFAFYLNKIPGCFFFLGNGSDVSCHNETFDFNDDLIKIGKNMWVNLIDVCFEHNKNGSRKTAQEKRIKKKQIKW